MAAEAVKTFDDGNFDTEVKQAGDTPVLVDFWAEWCMPCKALAPTIDELASEYDGKAKVGKLDIDSNREAAVEYQVSAIPTVLVFKGGEVVKRFVGMTSKDDLKAALDEAAG